MREAALPPLDRFDPTKSWRRGQASMPPAWHRLELFRLELFVAMAKRYVLLSPQFATNWNGAQKPC
jgi:hypothetical protein